MKDFNLISSRNNPLIKQINLLIKSADERKKQGLYVVEGLRICKDAFVNNAGINRLVVTKDAVKKCKDDIENFCKISANFTVVSDEVFSYISDTKTPQGIIMVLEIPETAKKLEKNKKYIALENLQDPSNLGAVCRTADALGFNGIILSNNGCDPYNPKVLRASMGTVVRMPIFFTDDISLFCKENGFNTVACVVDSTATDIKEYSFKDNDVVLIGNEANGLTEYAINSSSACVTIKMKGSAESLNAAAAAAIAMWEVSR